MMRMNELLVGMVTLGVAASSSWASAEIRSDKIFLAEGKKTQTYVKDGLITGGDQAINEFIVRDIRRAENPGFERVVIDLEANHNGESVAISRAPYYQMAVTPDEKRLVFTLFGKPRLGIDAKKVTQAFKKSASVDHLMLLPLMDENSWTFAFEMKAGHSVEVFELSNPVRIIMDIRTDSHKK